MYAESLRSLQGLTDGVAACIDAGVFRPADPAHGAGVLWAAVHGAVSLEIAGYPSAKNAKAGFDDLLAATGAWFLAGS